MFFGECTIFNKVAKRKISPKLLSKYNKLNLEKYLNKDLS